MIHKYNLHNCIIMFFLMMILLSLTETDHLCVEASRGDLSYEYRTCWYECVKNEQCFDHDYDTNTNTNTISQQQQHGKESYQLFNLFKFLEWNCEDNCHYDCMQHHAMSRSRKGLATWQYYGHWPFIRILGMEEPASALFSVANALPHLKQLLMISIPSLLHRYLRYSNSNTNNNSKLNEKNERNDYVMSIWVDIFPVVGLIAWIASTLFHIKKNKYTIPMDYVSALALLTYYLWMTIRRVSIDLFGSSSSSSSSSMLSSYLLNFVFICFVSLWMWQSYRIIIGLVPFQSHLQICIVIAGMQFILWLIWAHQTRSSHGNKSVLLQLYFVGAALLELFDFPPLFNHFDAHSLWHAATVPLGFWWFYFWNDDIQLYLKNKEEKENTKKESDNKIKKKKKTKKTKEI